MLLWKIKVQKKILQAQSMVSKKVMVARDAKSPEGFLQFGGKGSKLF
jgi:hypothetical protein